MSDSTRDVVIQAEVANTTLADRHDLNESLSILRVRPARGAVPAFLPGQHIELGLPERQSSNAVGDAQTGRPGGFTRRTYSIASPATERGYLEFFVVRIRKGRMTPQLWNLQVGDQVWLDDEAKGEFTIEDVSPDCDLVMVSTGRTGLDCRLPVPS